MNEISAANSTLKTNPNKEKDPRGVYIGMYTKVFAVFCIALTCVCSSLQTPKLIVTPLCRIDLHMGLVLGCCCG